MVQKLCTGCKILKNTSEFSFSNKSKGHLKSKCKICTSEAVKEAVKKDPGRFYGYVKTYRKKNPERALKSSVRCNRIRRRVDEVYRFRCQLSTQLRRAFTGVRKYSSRSRLLSITGLTNDNLLDHLHMTFKFRYGVEFDDSLMSKVEIDHIIPLSTAKTVEDVRRLNHYTNLQLLYKEDNKLKGRSHE